MTSSGEKTLLQQLLCATHHCSRDDCSNLFVFVNGRMSQIGEPCGGNCPKPEVIPENERTNRAIYRYQKEELKSGRRCFESFE